MTTAVLSSCSDCAVPTCTRMQPSAPPALAAAAGAAPMAADNRGFLRTPAVRIATRASARSCSPAAAGSWRACVPLLWADGLHRRLEQPEQPARGAASWRCAAAASLALAHRVSDSWHLRGQSPPSRPHVPSSRASQGRCSCHSLSSALDDIGMRTTPTAGSSCRCSSERAHDRLMQRL